MPASSARGRAEKGIKSQREARAQLRAMGVRCIEPAVEHEDLGDVVLLDAPVSIQCRHFADFRRGVRDAVALSRTQARRLGPAQVGIGLVRPPGRPEPERQLVVFELGDLVQVAHAFAQLSDALVRRGERERRAAERQRRDEANGQGALFEVEG